MSEKSKERKTQPWFRFHRFTINNIKVIRLPDNLHRCWIGLLCLTDNAGRVDLPIDDIAILLRLSPDAADRYITELIERELVDIEMDMQGRRLGLVMHDWFQWQYNDAAAAQRMKRSRAKKSKGSGLSSERVTPSVTPDVTASDTPPFENSSSVSVSVSASEYLSIGCKASQESERPIEDTYAREAGAEGGWDDADVFLDDEIGGAS